MAPVRGGGDGSGGDCHSERTHRITIKNRTQHICKKASELSTLCDVDLALVCYPPGPSGPAIWPSDRSKAEEAIRRYVDAPANKKHDSDGFPPSCHEDNVADHEAISDDFRGRNQGDQTTCRLCGRHFPSMKSLHGHMRQHKRNWRGVSPPPEENYTLAPMLIPTRRSSPPAKNVSSSNPMSPPFKWSMTGKRGRKAKEAATNPMHEEDGKEVANPMHEEEGKEATNPLHEEDSKEAANPMHEEESEEPLLSGTYDLLFLANNSPQALTPERQPEDGSSLPYDSRIMNNGDDLKISRQADSMDARAASIMHEEESEEILLSSANDLQFFANSFPRASTPERQQVDGSSLPYDSRTVDNGGDLRISRQVDSMDVKAASMNDVDNIEDLNQSIKKSETVCNKSEDASSFQSETSKPMEDLETATGVFMVTHQKQHQCTTCNKAFSSPQALGGHATSHWKGKRNSEQRMEEVKQAQGSSCQGGLPMKAFVAKHHRCNICSMAFPTGQALGGHKRKHWPGPPHAENSIANSSGCAAKRAYLIDLNKPPEPKEDEKI